MTPKRTPKGQSRRRDWTAPPADLDTHSKAFWKRVKVQLEAQGTWKDQDAPILERYVRSCQRINDARKVVAAEGMTARGSQGQLVEHPSLKTEREAGRDADRYEASLLLSPKARKAEATKSIEEEWAGVKWS